MTGTESLVAAAAAEARAEFFNAIVGYVATADGRDHTYMPEEIKLVTGGADLWERVTRAAVGKALVVHADQLMATAAELYRVARDIREGQ